MPIFKYPAVVWQSPDGLYTAAPVEDIAVERYLSEPLVGIGRSTVSALSQLAEAAMSLHKEDAFLSRSRLQTATLLPLAVDVRARQGGHGRYVPSRQPMRLELQTAWGRIDDGVNLACVATLGLRFFYSDDDDLRGMVAHEVQSQLRAATPQQLWRKLAPVSAELDELVVKVPKARPIRKHGQNDVETLASVAEPLDDRSTWRRFKPAWLRDELVGTLVELLEEGSSSVVLVGDTGVGKSTVLADAARRVARRRGGDLPRIWRTSAADLIAGTPFLGQWESRCDALVEALDRLDGCLCLENLHDALRLGGQEPRTSVAAYLAEFVRASELRLFAECTERELEAARRLLPELVGMLRVVRVERFSAPQGTRVLQQLAQGFEQNRSVTAEKGAAELTCRLFQRYLPYVALPGEAARFFQHQLTEKRRGEELTKSDVIARFTRRTGLPAVLVRDELPLSVEEVDSALRREVVGQDSACRALAEVLIAFKVGLNDAERPVAVLLFCGPTGVGKTQLARSLAGYVFGHGDTPRSERIVRLDMSEYGTYGSAARLLGESGTGRSELVEKVRQQPCCVILLDEIEKAAPEVFDLLLGVLDEGRLTDTYGRQTDFRSAIMIMTSNLGVSSTATVGFGKQQKVDYDRDIRAFFRPELYNRFDQVVPFSPLSPEAALGIVRKELEDVGRREGFIKRGLSVTFCDAVVAYLSRVGFDSRYGARNLQRAIEADVVTALARYLVEYPDLQDAFLFADLQEAGTNARIAITTASRKLAGH